MYWLGLTIALASGLFGVNLLRSTLRRYVPTIDDSRFDKALIAFLILGLSVTTINYFLDQHEIKSLKNQVDLLEYQEVSALNAMGNKSGKVNGVPLVRTPINDWSQSFVSRQEGKLVFRYDSSAIKTCNVVIKKLPSYPFAYYFLALCQKEIGDQSWKQNAQKAKSIFEKTIRIPSHHPDHDLILGEVAKMLKS